MKEIDEKTNVILLQWQTCVEMANSVSQRRDTMNNFFITINLAIATAISFVCDLKFFLINIIGIVTCVIWLFFIDNYKALNTEKFKVISELENKLPVKPFNEEWQRLKKNKKYRESTKLEKAFPYGFIFIYGVPVLKLILLFIFNR